MRRVCLLALAILLACQPGKTKEGVTPLIRKANYWSSVADESLPLDLTLGHDGSADMWLRCNRDAPQRQSLGRFHHAFPASEVLPIFGLIESQDFAAVTNPDGVVPGEVMRKITVETANDKEFFRFVGEASPPAPAFAQAEGAFLALVDQLSGFPDATLFFRVDQALPEKAQRGKEKSLVLTLTNVGRVPLRIHLPLEWHASGTDISLTGLRTDIPLDQMTNDHSRRIVFGPGQTQVAPAFSEGESSAVLVPGKSIAYTFRLTFDWPPGAYEAKLSFAFGMSQVSVLATERGPEKEFEQDMGRFEWISPGMPLMILKE